MRNEELPEEPPRNVESEAQRRAELARAQLLASQGQWAEAAPLYRAVIAELTDDVEALRGMGLVALHGDRPAEAVSWLTRASYSARYSVPILSELGMAQKRAGLIHDAIATYRRALTLDETDPTLLINLGRAERDAGRPGSAVLAFRRALRLAPESVEVWSMLSNALREATRLKEALEAARSALRIDPWYSEAHLNEGAALHATDAPLDAAVSYFVATTAPALRPAALANLQLALRALGQRKAAEEPLRSVLAALAQPSNPAPVLALARSERTRRPAVAIACFEHALRIQSDGAVARELGRLLWEQGRQQRAVERVLRAIAADRSDVANFRQLSEWLSAPHQLNLQSQSWQRLFAECPPDPPSLRNLGVAMRRHGYPLQAAALHRRALQLDPQNPAGWVNLGAALSSQSALPEAIAAYRRALELAPEHWDAHSNLLFSLHLDPSQTPEALLAEHVRFGQRLAQRVRPHFPQRAARPLAGRRLRVGYVSPDFRSHPVAHFIEPVLRQHDRGRVEIFCYSDVEHPDARTQRLAELAEHFLPCAGWSDQQLGERIASDGIDILVDLAGHTARNRLPLFASKPCPLQLGWLGYFDTTGLEAMDYRIADLHSLPPDAERFFVEKVVRLPRSANCFLPPAGPAPSPPPCLERGRITFGCYNNPAKIGREVVAAFARVLHAVPDSELVLKYLAFNEPALRQRYLGWFAAAGIAPERVRFEGPSALERFHDSFRHIDIALDPFPYSGETTALHTLWMGVPLVALEGPTLVQRLASRVLRIAGLDAWVARDIEDYVRIASDLARDPQRLELLRSELRSWLSACPLLDHAGVTRELEASYHQLWAEACERSAGADRA
ncbi:MAG: hypothetical protein RL033_1186 [Pseudomonadota bacterium]